MSEHLTVTPTPLSFTRKQLKVTFGIVNSDGSTDELTLEGAHRIRATISHAGMAIGSDLNITIEGMLYQDMNRLSFIENRPNSTNPTLKNQSDSTITVQAGIYGKALQTVFHGNIFKAYASYNGGSATFTVIAKTITILTKNIIPAVSYRGPQNVSSILSDICTKGGIILADHGGWGSYSTLTNHYGEGNVMDMLKAIVQHVKGTWDFEPIDNIESRTQVSSRGTFHVWGPNFDGTNGQKDATTPLISQKTGMIGYPDYSTTGLTFSCIFRNDVAFYAPVKIESEQIPAGWLTNGQGQNQQGQIVSSRLAPWNGTWLPIYITHELSSEIVGGPWLTYAECQRTDLDNPYAFPKSK